MKRILVFLYSRKSNLYARAIMVQVMWLQHAQRTNSPIWEAWTKAATAWNEETCEASLSQLSRVSTIDTARDQVAHVSDLYVLQGLRRRWLAEGFGFGKPRGAKGSGQHVKIGDPLVAPTVEHLKDRINQLINREFYVYAGDIRTWTTREETERIPLADAPIPDWSPAFAPHTFQKWVKRSHELILRSRWVERVEAGLEPEVPGTLVLFD